MQTKKILFPVARKRSPLETQKLIFSVHWNFTKLMRACGREMVGNF